MSFWKLFKIGDLFSRNAGHVISKRAKELSSSKSKNDVFCIANVTSCSTNNGVSFYLKDEGEISQKKKKGFLTLATNGDGGAGCCFFQDDFFVSTGDNSVIEIKNEILKKKADQCESIYDLFLHLITKILHNRLHGYQRKLSSDFDRELILLPVIACSESEAVWHDDDGTPITLDVDKISYLLSESEKMSEEKTKKQNEVKKQLLSFQFEQSKSAISSFDYKPNSTSFWKEFFIGDIFSRKADHIVKVPAKLLKTSKDKNDVFCIANVTATAFNNGVSCYLEDKGDVSTKKTKSGITISTDGSAGYAFYQKEPFVSTGHTSVLTFKSKTVENVFSEKPIDFICFQLTKALNNRFHGFKRSIADDFDRELILLPVIACSESEAVWHDDDGTPITLDVDKISYLLLKGKKKKLEEELSKVSA